MNRAASWKRLLVGIVVCAAMAFGIGLFFASDLHGFVQPAIIAMIFPAGVFGFLARRVFVGVVAAPLFGYAGAAGLVLRLTYDDGCPFLLEDYLEGLGVEGSLGGLICMVAGAVGGFVGRRSD